LGWNYTNLLGFDKVKGGIGLRVQTRVVSIWSRTKAREYIQEQAGKPFDQEVVKVFLDNIEQFESSS